MKPLHCVRYFSFVIALGCLMLMNSLAIADPSNELSLDMSTLQLATQDQGTGASASPGRSHPKWVTDIEAKMWPGFLTGMNDHQDFVSPVGMPLQFEDPFIQTELRPLYIYHDVPDKSVLRGGQIHVAAVEIRVALTERLAFIATKDGYSWVDTGITSSGDGWNDISVGLKYLIHSDPANQSLVAVGMRWEMANGSTDVFQGGDSQELSPFISFGKGWDKWHFLGAVTGRLPFDHHDANYSLVWNMHLDYELTDTFRPLIEVHGIHWLSDADKLPISVDYLDVGSLGASHAKGHDFFSAGIGFRWQAMENISVGLTYEFPLESQDENLMSQRVTLNTVVRF